MQIEGHLHKITFNNHTMHCIVKNQLNLLKGLLDGFTCFSHSILLYQRRVNLVHIIA